MSSDLPNGAIPTFRIAGTWERPAVSRHGDTTTLMVTVATTSQGDPNHAERLPISLALVLDRSGSMAGDKLELVKRATLEAVGHLGVDDTFSVVMFESMVQELIMPTPATAASRARLAASLGDVGPGGGTSLHSGWLTGCEHLARAMPGESSPHLHRAVLLTDGLANIGITDPDALTGQADALRQRGITTSTMGVGIGFNEVLLSGMAEAGGGNFTYIGQPHELVEFFHREVGELLAVAVPQPRLHLTFPPGLHARLVNPFPVSREGSCLMIDLRDMAANDEITLVFDITTAQGDVGVIPDPQARVELSDRPDAMRGDTVSFEPLRRVRARDLAEHAPDERVQIQAARIRADRDHREAMRLDLEGQVEEARTVFCAAMVHLDAAPPTEEIVAERDEARRLYESAGHLGEEVRKERVYRAMHRSRGHEPR